METPNYIEAKKLWDSFLNEVMYKHRFFLNHPFLDKLTTIAKSLEMMILPGKIYYRARLIYELAAKNEHMIAKCYGPNATEENRSWYRNKNNKFRGLAKEGCYVPPEPKFIRDGRSNPKFIRYLYVAESPTTAVYEIRPILFSAVNVAGIEVKEKLRIANIAVEINPDIDKSMDNWLLYFIQSSFSSPTNNPDDYIPSQIIAEYFQHLGYDGIRYSSSLHRDGYNLTIYDISKCEPVFSTDLRFENIKISLRPAIGAENIDNKFEYIVDNIPKRINKETGELVQVEI